MIRYVVFDVDDVVIDTDLACTLAERSVIEPLARRVGRADAERVQHYFSHGYDILRTQLRRPAGETSEEFLRHRERIVGWQRGVLEAGFELKLWSRDSLVAIALEDAGLAVDGDVLGELAARYWRVLAEETRVYEDAAAMISRLRAQGIAVHLATNSDGFLHFDEGARTFVYDPPYAVDRKIDRLEKLAAIGLGPIDVTVGDPIGKPKPEFYRAVLEDLGRKLGERVDPAQVLAVGDSLTNDVLPFLAAGSVRGAWLVRKRLGEPPSALEGHPGVSVIGSLLDLEGLLA